MTTENEGAASAAPSPLAQQFAQVRLNTNLVRDAIGFALAEKNIPHEPQWTLLAPQNLDNIDAALSSIERHVQDMESRYAASMRVVALVRVAHENHLATGDYAPLGMASQDALLEFDRTLAALPAREKGEE